MTVTDRPLVDAQGGTARGDLDRQFRVERTEAPSFEIQTMDAPEALDPSPTSSSDRAPLRPGALVGAWLLITAIGIALVLTSFGPLTAARDQRALLTDLRSDIESATNEAFGLAGVETPTHAPARGAPVAILDIDAIGLSQVVVEGTSSEETRQGPGHVVGTGGPGQPGNSVIVGRRSLFGAPFGSIDDLKVVDRILVTTVQGRSVYEVTEVDTRADATEEVYGPSDDDRLTLVTAGSAVPWASDDAQVVVAHLDGVAFAPTPQGGRTPDDDGRRGDPGRLPALILALVAYAGAVAGAVWLHRTVPWRSAYLLSAPLLVGLTIVLAEQVALTLPAWR